MSIVIISVNKLQNSKLTNFVNSIYNNFNHLIQNNKLKHTKDEIYRILKSTTAQVFLFLINNKIAGYLIGEIITLNDGRIIFYISYIFTAKQFRNVGIASKLIEIAEKITNDNNLDALILTCDTFDKKTYNWYLKKNFMPDLILRTNTRYEVLSK